MSTNTNIKEDDKIFRIQFFFPVWILTWKYNFKNFIENVKMLTKMSLKFLTCLFQPLSTYNTFSFMLFDEICIIVQGLFIYFYKMLYTQTILIDLFIPRIRSFFSRLLFSNILSLVFVILLSSNWRTHTKKNILRDEHIGRRDIANDWSGKGIICCRQGSSIHFL